MGKLFRTCVKENLNITEIFNELALDYLRRGGEVGLGISAVTALEDMAKNADGSEKNNNNNKGNASFANGGGGGRGAEKVIDGNSAFQLGEKKGPSVQRTGGKKKRFDFFV